MLILVIGGSGSGKSEYAQNRILESGILPRYYIATMEPYGEEGEKRIKRHLKLREGMDFHTIECPTGICQRKNLSPGALLVEDLSNLLSNEIWSDSGRGFSADLAQQIFRELMELSDTHPFLVLVGNDIHRDLPPENQQMRQFLEQLGNLHRLLAQQADEVVEVVAGIARIIKA
jgi:adenosylcobinamide kinase/adenosylcobinamide-phosphate guanylyltransferase